MHYITLVALLWVVRVSTCSGQSYEAGKSYYLGSYVEYLHGNMPLIISVPHGGYEKPDSIPERTGYYAKNQDIYTIEISYRIYQMIHKITGRYPYVIINHLHRTRLDANRNIAEAAGGNADAERVWKIYQSGIDSIKVNVIATYGAGLFIDLHGHRHPKERIELGYLLSKEELLLDDDMLNSGLLNEYTSFRNLLENNPNQLSCADLIRGEYSLGTILYEQGQPCVPSKENPMPGSEDDFFRGGYNTMSHGSSSGGTIDAIQIEIDLTTRTNKKRRKKVADDIAVALNKFMKLHYKM